MTTPDSADSNAACEVRLGSVLVSLMDAERGQEIAFHRWYERDHFYSGVMIGPWFFSGRRYVATRPLKELRFPTRSPVIDDIRKGSYLALYWILAGHHDAAETWAVRQVNQLIENDRMLENRVPGHAGFYDHCFSVARDPDGVPPELALEHPFSSVVMLMIDRAPDRDAEALERFVRDEHLPGVLRDSPAALCLGLAPRPLPDDAPAYVPRVPGLERRSLHLYFLDEPPEASWGELFARQSREFEARGLGTVSYAAPFIPTIPGSDRYADELW